jgi:hypothetical protein
MPTVPPGNGHHGTEPVQGLFEPPNSFVLSAIGRHKSIVVLSALIFAFAGIAIGLLRQPTYTASATLQVGQVNPNSPGFLGYVQSAGSLATAFSRSIAAGPVLDSVEEKLGLSRGESTPRLSSEPIPLSPAFRVIATGTSAVAATRLANVTAGAVVAYEAHSNSSNPQAASQLDDYQSASVAVRSAETRVSELENGESDSGKLLRAEAAVSAARIRLRAIANAYIATVATQSPRQGLVTLLAGATSASSDRKAKVELYGFVGLLIGLAVGCLAAVVRERRHRSHAEAPAAPPPEAPTPGLA